MFKAYKNINKGFLRAFSASTLSLGCQEEHPDCKKLID